MKCSGLLIGLAAALYVIGCDRGPSAPPGYTETTPEKPSDARPTTQELLSGTYKRLPLAPVPLTANVPQSWAVKLMAENLYFLNGPTPSGEVHVQLAERTSETSEKLERLFKAARRDAQAHAETTSVDIRTQGVLRVFDVRRKIAQASAPGDPVSAATSAPTPLMDWSVTYFVPRGSDFAAYELHFFNLTEQQFQKDREFLQKVLDSIAPEGSNLGIVPATAPH